MHPPKVSIIILNWNGLADTLECLNSIHSNTYPNYDVIVVDNASTKDSPDLIKNAFPAVTLIKNEKNLGYTGGNNVGMRYALKHGADYVWLLNNDTVIEPRTISELVQAGEDDPQVGTLSPIVVYYTKRDKIQFCGSYFDWKNLYAISLSDPSRLEFIEKTRICVWGTALLIKRKIIQEIGYLDENFFAYWEDFDYSLRVIRKNFLNKVVLSSKIFHKSHYIDVKSIAATPPHTLYYMTRNEYRVWRKNLTFIKKFIFIFKYLSKHTRTIAYCKEINHLSGCEACIAGIIDAFYNRGGPWDTKRKVPRVLKKIILWHPYFLADLLELNIRNIFAHKSHNHVSMFNP